MVTISENSKAISKKLQEICKQSLAQMDADRRMYIDTHLGDGETKVNLDVPPCRSRAGVHDE